MKECGAAQPLLKILAVISLLVNIFCPYSSAFSIHFYMVPAFKKLGNQVDLEKDQNTCNRALSTGRVKVNIMLVSGRGSFLGCYPFQSELLVKILLDI
jgi:hypothetical protein